VSNRYAPGSGWSQSRGGVRTDEKLLALGVPSHLVYRCNFLGSLGGGRPVINIESTTDVSIPELMTVFALGLGILIVPGR
jgi:hypothetical protein